MCVCGTHIIFISYFCNMIEKILNKSGRALVSFNVNKTYSSAKHEQSLMGDDFITLSWVDGTYQELPQLSYIVVDGFKYKLLSPYIPEMQAEGIYSYAPQFRHFGQMLSKVPFMLNTNDATGADVVEPEWSYTGDLATLAKKVADYIDKLDNTYELGRPWTAVVSNDVLASASCTFDGNDVLSAIGHIAQQFECEWYLDYANHQVIFGHISREYGTDTVVLKVGENVGRHNNAQKDEYFNTFIVRGGTRNVGQQIADGGNIALNTRLTLDKTKYPASEIYVNNGAISGTAPDEPRMSKVMTFDDIYPKVNLYVYDVRGRVRVLKDSTTDEPLLNTDGSYKTYTIWYMRLAYPLTVRKTDEEPVYEETINGTTYYWYDYKLDETQILSGHTLMVSWSTNEDSIISSSLAGREFELRYHTADKAISPIGQTGDKNYDSGVVEKKGDFEIVYTTENNLIIPTNEGEGLIPRGMSVPSWEGNKVILFNIAMGAPEIVAAQDELERKAMNEIAKTLEDLNEYTVSSNPVAFASSGLTLYPGQAVTFVKGNGGAIGTRVSKLVTDIDEPYYVDITVANEIKKGTVSTLKEDVRMILASGNLAGGTGVTEEQIKRIAQIVRESLTRGIAVDSLITEQVENATSGVNDDKYLLNKTGLNLKSATSEQEVIDFVRVSREDTGIETAGTKAISKSFSVGFIGEAGGSMDLPVSFGWSSGLVIERVNLTVVNDRTGVSINRDYPASVQKSPIVWRPMIDLTPGVEVEYTATLTIEYRHLGVLPSSLTETIGDSTDKATVVSYNQEDTTAESNVSSFDMALTRKDDDGNVVSGMRMTAEGLQHYENGVWKENVTFTKKNDEDNVVSGMRMTAEGLQCYDSGAWKENVTFAKKDDDGNVVSGMRMTAEGLQRYENGVWKDIKLV